MKCVYGRAGVRYVIIKFSRMDSLPNFLTHGAPLRARGAPLKKGMGRGSNVSLLRATPPFLSLSLESLQEISVSLMCFILPIMFNPSQPI